MVCFIFKHNLVPSLLALPVETLSPLISLLVKPKILHTIRKELEKKSNYAIGLNFWSVPGKLPLASIYDSIIA